MDKQKRLSKVIKLDQKKVKKIQKRRITEQQKQITIEKIKNFKFTKKHAGIIIIIVLGIVAYTLIQNYNIYGLNANKNITREDATIIETMNKDSSIYPYEDCLLLFEREMLRLYDYKGNIKWDKNLDGIFSPKVCVAGKYIQITNNDTGYIWILKGQYECARIRISGKILSANINDNGISVVEYSTSGLKTVISVYNSSGEELYGLKLDNNTVSSYCISDNLKYLAYAYADISGISLITKIDIISLDDLKKEEYVVNTIGNKSNELVYKMYWEGKYLNVLLSSVILRYNANTKETTEYMVDNTNAVSLDIFDDKLAYVTTSDSGLAYALKVDSFGGKNIGQTEIEELPKYFVYQDNMVYVCFQNELSIFNKWGWNIKNYKSDITITKPVIFDNGKCVATKVSNKIIIFKI